MTFPGLGIWVSGKVTASALVKSPLEGKVLCLSRDGEGAVTDSHLCLLSNINVTHVN